MKKLAKILAIDDDEDILKLYKRIFGSSHTVVVASNGEEGVNLFTSSVVKPDLVIMDYRMPKLDGVEATKKILCACKRTKIIFVTGDKSVEKLALSCGAVAVLEKPFSCQKLVDLVKLACSNE